MKDFLDNITPGGAPGIGGLDALRSPAVADILGRVPSSLGKLPTGSQNPLGNLSDKATGLGHLLRNGLLSSGVGGSGAGFPPFPQVGNDTDESAASACDDTALSATGGVSENQTAGLPEPWFLIRQ
jgi:hypothetical protein